jgi:hypothetical protein
VQAVAGRALVTIHGARPLTRVIDLDSGRVVSTLETRLTLLTGLAGPMPS